MSQRNKRKRNQKRQNSDSGGQTSQAEQQPESQPEASTVPPVFSERFEEAARMVGRAIDEKAPSELTHTMDEVERYLVKLRNDLIEAWRSADDPGEKARARESLDRANAVLSLAVGVEYPKGGVHRQLLEEAQSALSNK